jgi:putative DNA primase/helicase
MSARLLDMRAVAALLVDHIPDLACELVGAGPTARGRAEWRFRARGSLSVVVGGKDRGLWFDHEAGEGGGALGLVAHLRRCSRRDAHRWALDWLDLRGATRTSRTPASPPTCPVSTVRGAQRPDTLRLGRRLWGEASPAPGSPVEAYLAARGLALPDAEDVLRFHPRAWRNKARGPHGPAMLALMTDPGSAELVGVHVTYLRPDGTAKAEGPSSKIMLGGSGVVRLVPDEEVTLGLGLAEGIETTLAVMQGFGWRPVWAATCAAVMARFPVLPGVEALTLFADADDRGAGLWAALDCAARWEAEGREARVIAAPAGADFHDAMPGRAA